METENIIKCPNCDFSIDVNDILYKEVESKIKKNYDAMILIKDEEIQKRIKTLELEKVKINEERQNLASLVSAEVETKLKTEKIKIEDNLKKKLVEETSEQITNLQNELNEKSNQVKELNKTKAELEKLKREKDELRDTIVFEKEKELNEKIKDERQKLSKQFEEENNFKLKEREKIISDLKDQLNDAKRKAEQGSIQLQGEIQELELEKLLKGLYLYDEIEEVKKGQRGADIIQTILENGIKCGKIYYESKRTKNFDFNWIKKLKDDNLSIKADILVLVTEALPEGVDKFFLKDGVWICSFFELQGLSFVLRQSMININSIMVTQQGKEGKMELLYKYLTSQEFKGQLEAIIEGFSELQRGYLDEKLKMQKVWKEREKQLERILSNTVNFYGSLKGIAGSSIPSIKLLDDQ